VTTPEGLKKVDYGGLIEPLSEAVKELDDRLRAVEERLRALGSAARGNREETRRP
jgi:hypothetical protein